MTWNDSTVFAPESLLDNKGRRIMWAWVYDWRPAAMQEASGWSGEMSLPRVLWLGKDGDLKMKVPEELEQLRANPRSWKGRSVPADTETKIDGLQGNSLELAVDLEPAKGGQSGVKVYVSPDGSEQTLIYYDDVKKQLVVDARRSSSAIPGGIEAAPFELKKGEQLNLRIFIDKSMVEVFANDRQAVIRRAYPENPQSTGVSLFSQGKEAKLIRLKAWDMMPSNPY
jgi:beta-fructofuranosidase